MVIGIDRAAFYVPNDYLDLANLAQARHVPIAKYHNGLGQYKMAVLPPDEDIITMAAMAAEQVLGAVDRSTVDMVLFATESSIDQSKSAGMYLHGLLNLPKRCRVVELKQACYGATFGLQMAMTWVAQHPNSRVLIVASDVARYGLNTPGEPSQGCGAVAMVVSDQPGLLSLEPGTGIYSDDIMDFWRPNYRDEALVEGHYSAKMYLHALTQTWQHYCESSGRGFQDHHYFLYHTPVCRLVEKAHKALHRLQGIELTDTEVKRQIAPALAYLRGIGNTYTAALYISLISLLEHLPTMADKRIGLFSYGSGCVAEYFSGVVQPNYRDYLYTDFHQNLLKNRRALSIRQYEQFFTTLLPRDGGNKVLPYSGHHNVFRLASIRSHKRYYEKTLQQTVVARAPAKLILSGEYSVIQGKPAIAIAVDRFIETRVSRRDDSQLSFNLKDLDYHKSLAWQTLKALKTSIKRKHQKFLKGEVTIRDVVKQPFQLAQFAVVHLAEHIAPVISEQDGVKIETTSSIPLGCGMGSSAATVLSTQFALSHYRRCGLEGAQALDLAYESEQLQHGQASQVDLQTIYYGGCHYFRQGNSVSRTLPDWSLYLVNTGRPDVTTGDCVVKVLKQFPAAHPIWAQFESITDRVDAAIQQADWNQFKASLQANQQLLEQLGVVPTGIQQFIRAIEAQGGVAKVCGAGAVRGDQAGVLLLVSETFPPIEAVCKHYGYPVEPISVSQQGVHLV